MNTNNPNLAHPESLYQGFAHFDIDTCRFSGKKSYDGLVGGFPLMYLNDKRSLAVDATDSHTLLIGASGSKKTRSFILPTIKVLSHAGESMVINDPKGEIYNRIAGDLKELDYNIITLNLREPTVGFAWNPLQLPFQYYKAGDIDKAAEFANDIANILILGEISTEDPFWEYSAASMCTGLLLLLFRYCQEANMPDNAVNIGNLLALRRKLFESGHSAKDSPFWLWAKQDELIAASLSGSITTANDTMRGILSVFDQKLRSFAIQPTLLDMLANSNFDITDIGRRKSAVFLITPDEKNTFASIIAMFISQSYQHLIYSTTKSGGRVNVRINYVLDEFSSLPAIGSDFPNMISAARSRNIRYLICAQSKAQLVKRYKEEAATIFANCTNWVVLFTRELELLREVSELCGEKKDRSPNISVYDLQHLSKEKDEALLLTGNAKPCIVNLIDIDRLCERNNKHVEFFTPNRIERYHINYEELPPAIQEIADAKEKEDRERYERFRYPMPISMGPSASPNDSTEHSAASDKQDGDTPAITDENGTSDGEKPTT